MARKINTEEFIRMARLVHNDKYDYSKSHYTRMKDMVTITCRKHGDFAQRASTHLRGSGCVKCFHERNGGIVCSVWINDVGQSDFKLFTTWHGMLFRCYDKKYNTAYLGCEVCDEWKRLSGFASWYYLHYVKDWQLDKDILGNGKMYSPETCCFVPGEINMCVVGKDSHGITFVKGKWQASFSQKYIGRYDSKEDAIHAYKIKKGEHIKFLSEKYKKLLEHRVYEKLSELALRLCEVDKEITL